MPLCWLSGTIEVVTAVLITASLSLVEGRFSAKADPMPATPNWPPKSTPRLFVEQLLSTSSEVHIDGGAAHYLLGVLRLKTGAPVKLFDDRSGEYLATVTTTGKRNLILTVEAKLREREHVPDLWLCQALVKKDRFDWISEKPANWALRALCRC